MKEQNEKITVTRINGLDRAKDMVGIVDAVYHQEKNWIPGITEKMVQAELAQEDKISYFLAEYEGKPAGILRLLYDPELSIPQEYKVTFNEGISPEYLASLGRYAEIGRFMILPEYRRNITIALRLMRSAIKEVVERGYTHFITDVFEGEATSPYNFHTRILGFEVIGRHIHGELNCSCTRIILTMDILKNYQRLRDAKSRIFDSVIAGIQDVFEKKIKAKSKANSAHYKSA
jgi:hypothetical protein